MELHGTIRELSYQRLLDAATQFQPGQRVLVKILTVDRSDRNRIKVTASVKQAGANPVILSSSAQYAIFVSTPDHEPTREELMERLPSSTELVVIEGFRSEAEGAVEVSRKATGKGPKLSPEERIALISDNEELCAEVAAQGKPVFGLEDFADVARFFCSYAGIDPTRVRG